MWAAKRDVQQLGHLSRELRLQSKCVVTNGTGTVQQQHHINGAVLTTFYMQIDWWRVVVVSLTLLIPTTNTFDQLRIDQSIVNGNGFGHRRRLQSKRDQCNHYRQICGKSGKWGNPSLIANQMPPLLMIMCHRFSRRHQCVAIGFRTKTALNGTMHASMGMELQYTMVPNLLLEISKKIELLPIKIQNVCLRINEADEGADPPTNWLAAPTHPPLPSATADWINGWKARKKGKLGKTDQQCISGISSFPPRSIATFQANQQAIYYLSFRRLTRHPTPEAPTKNCLAFAFARKTIWWTTTTTEWMMFRSFGCCCCCCSRDGREKKNNHNSSRGRKQLICVLRFKAKAVVCLGLFVWWIAAEHIAAAAAAILADGRNDCAHTKKKWM